VGKKKQKLTFEESLAELSQIVGELEEGELGLSESLAKYEQAVGHLNVCHLQLEEAERKISLLTGVDAEGRPKTRKVQSESDESEGEASGELF